MIPWWYPLFLIVYIGAFIAALLVIDWFEERRWQAKRHRVFPVEKLAPFGRRSRKK